MIDPTIASAAKWAKPALMAGYRVLGRELARRGSEGAATGFSTGLEPPIDEALQVLAKENQGIGSAVLVGLKALVARPELFRHPVPCAWIKTSEAQAYLKRATLALIRGDNAADIADAAFAHYRLFLSPYDDPGETLPAPPPADEAWSVALDFIQRSLLRDVSPGELLMLNAIAALGERMEKVAPHQTSELVDQRLRSEVEAIRRRRFFRTADTRADAIALAAALGTGRLQSATPPARAWALAWCARWVCYSDPELAAEMLSHASAASSSECDEVEVARAFLAAPADWRAAIAKLDIDASPLQATAALQIARRALPPSDLLAWIDEAAIEPVILDADGRYILMSIYLEKKLWHKAFAMVGDLGAEDFELAPSLEWMSAAVLVANGVPDDLRHHILHDIPPDPARFYLAEDGRALSERRIARGFLQSVAIRCRQFELGEEAAAAERIALWLGLRDPDHREEMLAELRERINDEDSAIAYLPLALAFGIDLDRDFIENRVDRRIARAGDPPHLLAAAVLALVLDRADHNPGRSADYVKKHYALLAGHLENIALISLNVRLLALAGRAEEARAFLASPLCSILEESDRPRLLSLIDEPRAEPTLEELEERYAAERHTPLLAELLRRHAQVGVSPRFVELAREFLTTAPTVEGASMTVQTLLATGHYLDAVALLDLVPDLVERNDVLLERRAWVRFRLGRLGDAEQDLVKLEARLDNDDTRSLRFHLLVASGRWAELDRFVDLQWSRRDERSGLDLVRFATLAAEIGSKWTRGFIEAAIERAPNDPDVLAGAYHAATAAGLEDAIPEAGHWIMRAAELSGEGGPVWSASIEGLLEQKPAWDERVLEADSALAKGNVSLESAAAMLRRPWLEMQLIPLIGNLDTHDRRQHAVVPLFSGKRRARDCRNATSIALDRSVLVSLAVLDLLPALAVRFEKLHVAHGLLTELFEQRQRIRFHQPSRVEQADGLIALLERKKVRPFASTGAVDPELVPDIGLRLAELLSEAARQDEGQHFVVHPFPITRVGSMLSDPVDLPDHRGRLVSCHAVLDALDRAGQITRGEMEHMRAYLDGHDRRWPDEPVIEEGATLYLSDLSVSYLRYIQSLPKLSAAGLVAVISQSELSEARALREWDALGGDACNIIESIADWASAAIERGQLKLGEQIDDERHPGAAAFGKLAEEAPLIACDDRFISRYEYFDHESDRTRIVTSADIIDELETSRIIDSERAIEARTRLRCGGALFMPIDADELRGLLPQAAIVDGKLRETAELRAIRENIRLAQLRGWLTPPADVAWLLETQSTLIDAIVAQWQNGNEAAAPRSDWLAALLFNRDWADIAYADEPATGLAESIFLDLSRLSIAYHSVSPDHQMFYADWLEGAVIDPLFEGEPTTRTHFLAHLRGLTTAAIDNVGAPTDPAERRRRIQIGLVSLPPFLQYALLEDEAFRLEAQVDVGYSVGIGDNADFPRADFLAAVLNVYQSPDETVVLADDEGHEWTLQTDASDPGWPLFLAAGEMRHRVNGIFPLLPEPDLRLAAFESLASTHGAFAEEVEPWRALLAERLLEADEIERLEGDLNTWPRAVSSMIERQLGNNRIMIGQLVPDQLRYYERLVGEPAASNLKDYQEEIVGQHIARLRKTGIVEGARAALLLASHPQTLASGRFGDLSRDEWLDLADWVTEHGDPFTRAGFLELALAAASEVDGLADRLIPLIDSIEALDSDDENGPIYFFAQLLLLVDGELSRNGALAGWPPFLRRAAACAQAGLIHRAAYGRVNHSNFANFCRDQRGWRCIGQGLVDLRLEPRWRPDFGSPAQLRHEIIGRVVQAAWSLGAEKLPPHLNDRLLGKNGLIDKMEIPMGYWPGPLEGAISAAQPQPPSPMIDEIEGFLAADVLTVEALTVLANVDLLFRIPRDLVERAAERIETAGTRLIAAIPSDRLSGHLLGLAHLAASSRSERLADQVCVLARFLRNTDFPLSIVEDIQLALVSAASRSESQPWREFAGNWLRELAVKIEDTADAAHLASWLDMLFSIDPAFRTTAGRAKAALRLMLSQ